MKAGILATVLVVLVLAAAGIAYHLFERGAAKGKIAADTPLHLSEGFRQPARDALAAIENPDVEHADRLTAMIKAQKAQVNDADRVAMVTLQDYLALVSTSNRNAKEQRAYDACRAASHSVLEREGETTLRTLDPCFAAAQELQPNPQ